MPGWLIALAFGLAGLLVGIGLMAALIRAGYLARPRARPAKDERAAGKPTRGAAAHEVEESNDAVPFRSVAGLVARAMREPLARLRRIDGPPPDLLESLERLAWQCRMLGSSARPMQARPAIPRELLERAAEEVPLLRFGKVSASWTLKGRQPVYVDSERARAALRELLASAAEQAGEGGRIAIRVLPAGDSRYPVCLELEIGRTGAEFDPLALRVARHLLEGQGARLEVEGERARTFLRSLPADAAPQTPSNT